tara:strand:- start:68 stop:247 length:180 start_codon:yes stop_codon:yes gene_type:complete
MQTTIEQTDYIGQQAQLIAIRYLAEKHQERLQRQQNRYFYAMAGLVVVSYIGAMTFYFS